MTTDEALHHAADLERAGRFADAEQIYRQILAADPNNVPALEGLARIALHFNHLDAAERIANRVILLNPTADAYLILAATLHPRDRKSEALEALTRASALAPNNAATQFNMGMILWELKQYERSHAAYVRALKLDPDFALAHHGMMTVLGDLGRFHEAVEHGRRAEALGLNTQRFWGDFGVALHEIGDLKGAIQAEEHAVAVAPNDATVHFNLSQLLLLDGQYQRGWREHEWRWNARVFPSPRRNFPQPMWDGSPTDKTLLVHAEQGAGDTIMAARYLPVVCDRAKFILECQPELVRLMRTVQGVEIVIARGQPLPAFDLHVPILSLPLVFNTTVESIPANVPYVKADPAQVHYFQSQIAQLGARAFTVGIAWAGSPTHVNDINRSMPFAQLSTLRNLSNVRLFSLQKGPRRVDATGSDWLVDWTVDLHDFADTAALIQNLDLVVTVDTSIAHVAGAAARPVWTMLPFAPDWRWLASRPDTTPWYPTMRLFRQARPRQWSDVIDRVAQELRSGVPCQA